MQTQNMKLLDLQTGKYLELDKDFWLGGDIIILLENLKRSTNAYSLLDEVNACARFRKEPHTNIVIKEICEKIGAVVYGERYVLFLDPSIEKNLGNIFEEYSKQQHNEPNNFDELKELFK